jgi:hypothetical protein
MLKRPRDRRRERIDDADRRIRSRAWADATRTLARDPAARVTCPDCAAGRVSAEWVAFKSGAGGEWVAQCDACGAWYATACRGARDDA